MASGIVPVDISRMLFAIAGTDQEMEEHSPLRAGGHFGMGDEPPGSGGGTELDEPEIVPVANTNPMGDGDGFFSTAATAEKKLLLPLKLKGFFWEMLPKRRCIQRLLCLSFYVDLSNRFRRC